MESLENLIMEKGHEVVILDGKTPIRREWQKLSPSPAEVGYWKRRGMSIGIKLKGLVVVDVDEANRRCYDWRRHRRIHRSPMEVQTRRGVHFYFKLPEIVEVVTSKIKHLGLPVDLLTGNRFAVAPGSVVNGFTYTLREGKHIVPPGDLPEFPVEILQHREPTRAAIQTVLGITDERAMKYVDRIDAAVAGSSGSRQTFVACLKILSLVNGDVERAWPLLLHYNARCVPMWDTEAETGPDSLKKKLKDAAKIWKPRP